MQRDADVVARSGDERVGDAAADNHVIRLARERAEDLELGGDFRAVFSFGPVDDVAGYGEDFLPVDITDDQEIKLPWIGQGAHLPM